MESSNRNGRGLKTFNGTAELTDYSRQYVQVSIASVIELSFIMQTLASYLYVSL